MSKQVGKTLNDAVRREIMRKIVERETDLFN
jgi:hypothetical protein